MLPTSIRVAAAALLACSILPSAAALNDAALQARITRIENGLLPPVAVSGSPSLPMRLRERMQALHVPGLSIAVIDKGVVEWTGAYGVADAATGRPVTTDTLFSVASVGKSAAAILTVQLASDGVLGLDEDINQRLRHWRLAAQRPVTARALLSHAAGLPGFGLLGYRNGAPTPTLLQVLAGAAPAANPPALVDRAAAGQYVYSSLGYTVLEQAIVDATGVPFDRLARDRVFAPLGMADTFYAQSMPAALAGRAAAGHELDGSVVDGKWRSYPELAAAGLWSTAGDLARLAIAVQRAAGGAANPILTRQQAKLLLTPVQGQYGLGFELDHDGPTPAFHHSGSNAGYKALLFAYEEGGQGAVILTNGDAGWALIEELMRAIAAEYGWPDYRQIVRRAAPANLSLFERFTGDFKVGNTTLRISRDGQHLYIAGPPIGPAPAELIAAGDDDYFIREKNLTVHFDPNGGAAVRTLTMVDGRPRAGTRIEAAVVP